MYNTSGHKQFQLAVNILRIKKTLLSTGKTPHSE
jgi:hypothetical protein